MNYFSVKFRYHGIKINSPDIDQKERTAEKALFEAEEIVTSTFEFLKLQYVLEYSFPDGSLFYWIKTDLNKTDLDNSLKQGFNKTEIYPAPVLLENPNDDLEDFNLPDVFAIKYEQAHQDKGIFWS